ncbi:MAG: hypothetical protein HZC42_01230 [Candidatus Eisenbacteria bacterium]|nr:hypothetical protein [Candidatus Eisenbacteria bacterium]
MKAQRLIAAAIVWSVLGASAGWSAPALPNKDADLNCGVPQWAATPTQPMVLQIIGRSPTDSTRRDTCVVTINNLPQFVFNFPAFVAPAALPRENLLQYRARYNAAAAAYLQQRLAAYKTQWEAASKDKADRIAAAMNATPCGAGRATSSQVNNPAGYMQGRVTITNAFSVTHGARSNTTGEVGDGVRFRPGAAGTGGAGSYGGSLGSPITRSSPATGVDPSGGPSVVEIGILGRYVATWYPLPGDTYDDVMLGLEALLDSNGLPATFSPGSGVLALDGTFGDEEEFFWSMSEPGFDGELGVTYGLIQDLSTPVQHPSWGSLKLPGIGCAVRSAASSTC